jgi:chemotaxis response regulator CheB
VIRVLIADDHPTILRVMGNLLAGAGDMEVVGDATSFDDALRLVKSLRPDVVVAGMNLKNVGHGSHDLAHFASSCACIIIATSFALDDHARELAQALGAASLLDKITLGDTLIPAIRDLVTKRQDSPGT